ncbi:allophanate hydrolase subunit 1 [Thalassotalea sp. HSM 43]|uniref:5-oxoprolinase subunit B family protein n=1 Tax=Thalassotalea sp. HSM 43 TaxID=2552945 RepID=UPI00108009F0|nr:allophanate hydrolase subunit 1 [Thalassotalea sp. HSM 43]QBY03846.1 allophanate hydrolase subunit 1 [Thalassotalea sp. HSM 43]
MANHYPLKSFQALSETAILFCWAEIIDPQLNQCIHRCKQAIANKFTDIIVDIVCSYSSMIVHLQPPTTANTALLEDMVRHIKKSIELPSEANKVQSKLHHIDVYYGYDAGWDLAYMEQQCQLTLQDIIARHTAPTYQVFANGFMPGFAYMGIIDQQLILPRHSTPRTSIPKGAVAIAEQQTAIYPKASPGGWLILGQTAMSLITADELSPTPVLQAGDQVKFNAISEQQFVQQGGSVMTNNDAW